MTDFQFEGEPDLKPEDEVSIIDGVRRGDRVYLERVDAHHVHIRTLAPGAEPPAGPVYVVDRGDEPGTVKFTLPAKPTG